MGDQKPRVVHDEFLQRSSRFFRLHLKKSLIVLVLAAGYLAYARLPVIFVTEEKNGVFSLSSYPLKEDNFHHPRLELLRTREHLDDVIAPGKTQFDKIVLLRAWVHRQWKLGDHFYYPAWDGAEILDLARRGNRGFCAQYAILFLQACQSLGLHARYVELPGHFITAVWVDDLNKWVIMDPTYDLHYERDGVPMSGREMCDAYWKNDTRGMVRVSSDGTRVQMTHSDLNIYRMISILLDANQLSSPVTVFVNGEQRLLPLSKDYKTYPLIGRDHLGYESDFLAWQNPNARERFTDRPGSDDPDDFSQKENQTVLFVARRDAERGMVKILLVPDSAPGFKNFEFKINDNEWQNSTYNKIFWKLDPGLNVFSARIRTSFGWEGPVSTISLYYKPKLFPFTSK